MQTSNSVKKTLQIAATFAKKLKPGDVVILCADLGSGKTVFARGIINAFGVKEPVTSPTFTIVNKYDAKNLSLYHFDMYRLEDYEEALAAGLDELIEDSQSIKIIEWPERCPELLPEHYYKVTLTKVDDNTRTIDWEEI